MSHRGLSGQSAIEYLMTYGWMLLVVAVVGGAIFATVGDQSVESVSGFNGDDLIVDKFGATNSDELQMVLRNTHSDSIEVKKVNLTDEEDRYSSYSGSLSVDVSDAQNLSLANVSQGEGNNQLDVEVVYDSGGLENLTASGTITGFLELTSDASEKTENSDGGGPSLLTTKTYTFTGSKETVDLKNDFSKEVQEIKIVEMHGADGSKDVQTVYDGGSGGLITNASVDISSYSQMDIWVGETTGDITGGFGNATGGSGGSGTYSSGGGGGSTELWLDNSEMVAVADAGGGGYTGLDDLDGGGGARGGLGYQDAEGNGMGGNGGTDGSENGEDGGQELGLASLEPSGQMVTGGSDDGSGKIVIEYYG